MQIQFNEYTFYIMAPEQTRDLYNVYVTLTAEDSGNEELWNCNLKGLWRDPNSKEVSTNTGAWRVNQIGDYFQESLHRNKESKRAFHGSYTAIFHEMIKANRNQLKFIHRLYSTSRKQSFSLGYNLYPEGQRFWKKQEEKGLAKYIPDEERYIALF